MKITISGDPGSGKGTVANLLVKKLKWPVINAGDFKREIAFQKNMNILEFSKKYTTAELDDMIDSNTKDFCAKNENAIIDGRRAWFHVPDSFKVFLKCDPDEAAKRIYKAQRGNIEAGKTIVEIHQKIIERQKRDRDFMLSHDKADLTDMNNYDLVIDTTNITAKQAAEQILRAFKH